MKIVLIPAGIFFSRIRYVPFIMVVLLFSSNVLGQIFNGRGDGLFNSGDVYTIGDTGRQQLVIIARFIANDGAAIAIHGVPGNTGKDENDWSVLKVFRGQTEITDSVEKSENYGITLGGGENVVFVTGSYNENGKQRRVTRVLPLINPPNYVSPASNGGLLVTQLFLDNSEQLVISRKYTIDQNGQLLGPVQSVVRGKTDLMPDIRSGKCTSIPLVGFTIHFSIMPQSKAPSIVTMKGDQN